VLFITAEKHAETAPWEHVAVVSEDVRKGDADALNSVPFLEIPWATEGPSWRSGLMPRRSAGLYSHEIQSKGLKLGHAQSPWNMGGRVTGKAKAAAAALLFSRKHANTIFHQNAHSAHEAPRWFRNHCYTDCAAVICERYPWTLRSRESPLLPEKIEPHTTPYTGIHPAAGRPLRYSPAVPAGGMPPSESAGKLSSSATSSAPNPLDMLASEYMNTLATRPSVGHLAKAIPARDRPWFPANHLEAAHYALASRVYGEELRLFNTIRRWLRNLLGFL
jgi:hypothetical protein